MRFSERLAVGCLVAAAVTGCSLFVSIDDDLAGGSPPPEAGDGGPAPPDGGGPTTVAPAADASPGPDGARDAGPFCPGHPGALFCEDFDTLTLPGTFLGSTTENGSVARTTSAFASAGHALESVLLPQIQPVVSMAVLNAHVTAGAALVGEVKLRVEQRAAPSGETPFSEVFVVEVLEGGKAQYQVGVNLLSLSTGMALQLFEFTPGTNDSQKLGPRVPVEERAWIALELSVDVAAKQVQLRRTDVAGAPVLASSPLVPPTTFAFPRPWQLLVGQFAFGAQTGWRVLFDDALVRTP